MSDSTTQGASGPTLARVIAIMSLKGGVGKSTAAVQLAGALSRMNLNVLLVDADSTCSASLLCGLQNTSDLAGTVGAVVLGQQMVADVVHPILPGLDLLRGTTSLHMLETFSNLDHPAAAGPDGHLADLALRAALDDSTGRYDLILIDCAGGHPKTIRMALLAADEVLVPTGLSLVDLNATAPTLDLIVDAQEARGEDGRPQFLGFLPNGAGKGGVPAKFQALLDQFGYPCFTPIRASALMRRISEAPTAERRFIVVARPDHPAAQSYAQVAKEILHGIGCVPAAVDTLGQGVALAGGAAAAAPNAESPAAPVAGPASDATGSPNEPGAGIAPATDMIGAAQADSAPTEPAPTTAVASGGVGGGDQMGSASPDSSAGGDVALASSAESPAAPAANLASDATGDSSAAGSDAAPAVDMTSTAPADSSLTEPAPAIEAAADGAAGGDQATGASSGYSAGASAAAAPIVPDAARDAEPPQGLPVVPGTPSRETLAALGIAV